MADHQRQPLAGLAVARLARLAFVLRRGEAGADGGCQKQGERAEGQQPDA